MSKILKYITIFFFITAVVITAGCSGRNPDTDNISEQITSKTEATPEFRSSVTSLDPQLVISPENKFPVVNPGEECDDKVTINSTLGDTYNITLYAHSIDERLAVYVDGKDGGPFESNEILKGNGESINVSIQASPKIEDGNYTILLNSTYYDIDHHLYTKSNSITVIVQEKSLWSKLKR